MSSFTGKKIANTYKDLLKVATSVDNAGIDSTLRRVQDGNGTNSALSLSQNEAKIHGSLGITGTVSATSIQLDGLNVSAISATDINAANKLTINNAAVATETALATVSATLETRIAAVSSTMATSIANVSSALETRIAAVSSEVSAVRELVTATNASAIAANTSAIIALSATMATSISNHLPLSGGTLNGDLSLGLNTLTVPYMDVKASGTQTVFEGSGTTGVRMVADATFEIKGANRLKTMFTGGELGNTTLYYNPTTLNDPAIARIRTQVSGTTLYGNVSITGDAYVSGTIFQAGVTVANTSAIGDLQTNINTVSAGLDTANTSIAANTSSIVALSATLETRIATVSSTMATSIANVSSALETRINAVSVLAETKASAGTSTNLETRINSVSVLAETKASAATSANLETRINAVSVLAETKASAATSANLETRINTVSALTSVNLAAITSINAVALRKDTALSATSGTFTGNVSAAFFYGDGSNLDNLPGGGSMTNITAGTNIALTENGTTVTDTTTSATINVVGVASAGTSASLETRIASVSALVPALSATMATSISNSNTAIATLSATMATSISNSNTAIAALSATMATSISNHLPLAGGTVSGNLAVTGDLTVDTNTLYVDSTNNEVGIGTSSPEGTLHVENVSNNSIIMDAPANRYNSIGFQTAGVDKWWIGRADSDQISGDAFFIGIDDGNATDAGGLNNKLVINQSGDVGIGTSDIKGTLHAKNTSDNATLSSVAESIVLSHQSGSYTSGNYYNVLGFAKANSNGGTLGASIAPTMDGSGQTTALTFGVASGGGSVTERMRIDSSGNVGIGTDSPARKLDVRTSGTSSETVAQFGNANIPGGLQVQTNGNLDWGFNALNTRNLTFSTNQTERMRIDSSGRVGLGETSPSKKLVLSENDSECVMIIKSSDTGTAGVYLGDQSDEIVGGIIYDNNTDTLQLRSSNNNTAVTINSSELVILDNGITFNGDTAAANVLDDYEEGTWTPALVGSSSRTGTWDSTLTATYTKIGRLVMVTFQTSGTSMSFSTTAGYSYYSGLPFAVQGAVGASWASSAISGAGAGTVYVDTSERVWIYAPINASFSANAIYTSFVYYTT